MSKATYPYPPDEFDVEVDPHGPRGTHRAPRSAWSRIWPFLLVLVLVPLVAFAVVAAVSNSASGPAPSGTTEASGPADTTDAPEATEGTEGTEPSESASPEETETAEPEPEPTVEFGTPVEVLNASNISGLAARTAQALTDAGFTDVTAGNERNPTGEESTVFYATPELEVTARQVAETVGVGAVAESADSAGDGVSVVLLSDPGA